MMLTIGVVALGLGVGMIGDAVRRHVPNEWEIWLGVILVCVGAFNLR